MGWGVRDLGAGSAGLKAEGLLVDGWAFVNAGRGRIVGTKFRMRLLEVSCAHYVACIAVRILGLGVGK